MKHVILRQVIEILTDGSSDVFALQQRLSDLYHDEIAPVISQTFDDCSDEESTLYIDQIIIDLGNITERDLDHPENLRSLMLSVARQITDQLKYGKSQKTAVSLSVSSATPAFEAWLFYMEHGYLKWNVTTPDDTWYERVLATASGQRESIESLRALITHNDRALRRIALQHTQAFLTHLVEALTAKSQLALPAFIEELSVLSALATQAGSEWAASGQTSYSTNEIWQAILLMTSADPDYEWSTERIVLRHLEQTFGQKMLRDLSSVISDPDHEHIRKAIPGISALMPITPSFSSFPETSSENETSFVSEARITASPPTVPADPQPNKGSSFPPADKMTQEGIIIRNERTVADTHVVEEGIFVRHAGLVILHPFLVPFFTEVNVVKDRQFISSVSIHKAMLLLQYLASADDCFQEYEMVIAKVLCGFPLQDPIDISIILTDRDKSEAEGLLKDVISQWTILQNTSPFGLREGFLQRPGKYYIKNEQHYVHVENSSIDILLDRLPWGLSMIKLPWMKHLLNVEWR